MSDITAAEKQARVPSEPEEKTHEGRKAGHTHARSIDTGNVAYDILATLPISGNILAWLGSDEQIGGVEYLPDWAASTARKILGDLKEIVTKPSAEKATSFLKSVARLVFHPRLNAALTVGLFFKIVGKLRILSALLRPLLTLLRFVSALAGRVLAALSLVRRILGVLSPSSGKGK